MPASANVNPGDIVKAEDHNNLRTDVLGSHHQDALGTLIVNADVSDTASFDGKKIKDVEQSFPFNFYFDGADVSAIETIRYKVPKAGYLTLATSTYTDTITAGTITLAFQKNGSALTGTSHNHTLNSSNQYAYSTVAHGTTNYDFSAGDTLSCKVSSSSLAPNTGVLSVSASIHFTN